jgi:hypothetical protein
MTSLTKEDLNWLHDRLGMALEIANRRANGMRDRWASDEYRYFFELQGLLFFDQESFEGMIFELFKHVDLKKTPIISLDYPEQAPFIKKIEVMRKLMAGR